MKNTLLIAFTLMLFTTFTHQTAYAERGGHFAWRIIKSMPDDMREEFRAKMKAQRKQWEQEGDTINLDMKLMIEQLAPLLGAPEVDQKELDAVLQAAQDKIMASGSRSINRVRSDLADTISKAPLEQRLEMAQELNEALQEWEPYQPRRHRPRWWQFWRR